MSPLRIKRFMYLYFQLGALGCLVNGTDDKLPLKLLQYSEVTGDADGGRHKLWENQHAAIPCLNWFWLYMYWNRLSDKIYIYSTNEDLIITVHKILREYTK